MKLSNFESNTIESTLLQGEELLDQNQVVLHNIADKSLYIFHTPNENSQIETEVLVNGSTVKSFRCDCEQNDSKDMCKHIIVGLFLIRRLKSKPQQAPKKRRTSTYSVDQILDNISQEELVNFVKAYSRKDQKFNLTMKASFARRVSTGDIDEKYHKILDKIIKPITKKNSRYASSSINKYIGLATELEAQMKDALSLEQYEEAFYIHKNLLQKTAYAILNAKNSNEKLEAFYDDLHDQIDVLYQTDMAPELKLKLSEFLLETLSYSYYIFPNFQNNLARKVMKYASNEINQKLTDVLQKKFSYTYDKFDLEMILTLELLGCGGSKKEYSDILSRTEPEYLKNMFSYLLAQNEYKTIIDFIKFAKEDKKVKAFPFEDITMVIANRKDDDFMMANALYEKYFRTRSSNYLSELFNLPIVIKESLLKKIEKVIKARNSHEEFLIDIAFERRDFDKGIELIKKQENLDALERFLPLLLLENQVYADDLLHFFLNKTKQSIFHFHRYFSRLKNIYLENTSTENELWNSLFILAEQEHKVAQE